ncbi:hypothetical protein ACFXK0_10505 [Nocardia sp. NPDC059177]|uniref:hypothetical protein n=1 Tax=Nocardia sp. NPDC059177 TaxID=3346759 RepID=UPI0036901B1D
MRRLLLAAALLVTVVACGPQDQPPAPYWTVEATTDDQVFEMLRQARGIEACALIPRTELAELGTPGPDQLRRTEGCGMTLTTPGGPSSFDLMVVAGIFDGAWSIDPDTSKSRTVGGATVVTIEDRDSRTDRSIPEGERWCRVDVKYPASVGFRVSLHMPASSDPCPAAERLAEAAMAKWTEQPQHGTTPGLPRSILTGVDPCAVPVALGASIAANEQQLGACSFRLDGVHTGILFDYYPEASFAVGRRDDRGRYILPDGYALMKGQLGPSFTVDEDNRPLVPAVSVGGDTPTSHRVMNAVLDHFLGS